MWSGGSRLARLPFPFPFGLAAGLDVALVVVLDAGVGASGVDSGGCVSVLVAVGMQVH